MARATRTSAKKQAAKKRVARKQRVTRSSADLDAEIRASLARILQTEPEPEPEPVVIPPSPTAVLHGQLCTLADLDAFFTRCRRLVDGMAVHELMVDFETYVALRYLLEHNTHGAFTGTPAWRATWNEIPVVGPRPTAITPYTLDLSDMPFVYCNQAGVMLQLIPPWEDALLVKYGAWGSVGTEPTIRKPALPPTGAERNFHIEREDDE